MAVDIAMRTRLLGDAAVVAVVGYGAGLLRYYPLVLPPKAALPALVYQQIDVATTRTHDRAQTAGRTRFQIKSWSDTLTGAKDLAALIKARLDGFKGTVGSFVVLDTQLVNELDERDAISGRQAVVQDYMVTH